MISRLLAATVETLTRAHAAAWLLSGRPVIYGAHLNGPLKVASAADLLVSRCHIEAGSVGIEIPSHVPSEWSA